MPEYTGTGYGEIADLGLDATVSDVPRRTAEISAVAVMPSIRLTPLPYLWVLVGGAWRPLHEQGLRVKVEAWREARFWEGLWICVAGSWRRAIPFRLVRTRFPVSDIATGEMPSLSVGEYVSDVPRITWGDSCTGDMPAIDLGVEV